MAILLTLGGYLLHPKEYNGHPVVGMKRATDGLVYVLGAKSGEKEEIERIAQEGNEAAADIKFTGTKP